MKKIVLFLFLSLSFALQAQQANKIIEDLQSEYPGQGKVVVYQEDAIKSIVGRNLAPKRQVFTTGENSVPYVKMRGFKIQAFSGNNQRTSKNEAYRKQSLISQAFPEHEAVVAFDSPFWRLRVGNFRTRGEASDLMRDLRKAFPAFGKEMYIVIDEVKIPIEEVDENQN